MRAHDAHGDGVGHFAVEVSGANGFCFLLVTFFPIAFNQGLFELFTQLITHFHISYYYYLYP